MYSSPTLYSSCLLGSRWNGHYTLKTLLKGTALVVGLLGLAFAALMLDTQPTRLFGGALIKAMEGPITGGMFVNADTDAFDPGLPVGARFPPVRALFQGQEITSINEFVEDRGAIFVAVRSADW